MEGSAMPLAASTASAISNSTRSHPPAMAQRDSWPERGIAMAGGEHHHRAAELDPAIEVDHVLVGQPDAAGGYGLPDIFGLVGAVDAEQRVLAVGEQVHAARAHRILRTAGNDGRKWAEAFVLARGRGPGRPFRHLADLGDARPSLRLFADGDTVADRLPVRLDQIEKAVIGVD